MSKAPPNLPIVGDTVRLRGKGGIGIVLQITKRNWVEVVWKPITQDSLLVVQPRLVHLFELEKIDAN